MNDTPLLKTPGEMISEARGARGLTLAQLSERTKIPPPVLAALELDEYHKISGPLYIKSFLRTCALDLGLDPEVVLGLYNKISGEKQQGAPGSETVWGVDDVQVSRIGLPWLRIVLAVGVAAVLVGLGLFALRGCGSAEPAGDEVIDVSREPEETREWPVVAGENPDPVEASAILPDSAVTDEPTPDPEAEPEVEAAADLPDTLARAWILRPELPEETAMVPEPAVEEEGPQAVDSGEPPVESAVIQEAPPEREQVPEQIPVQEPAPESIPVSIPESAQELEPEASPSEEPAAVISSPSSQVDDVATGSLDRRGSSWPLVLKIECPSPQQMQVKRDGDREFSSVRWPAEGEAAPAIPPAGFEAGRAYRLGDGWVVFWGGEDHFGVILDRIAGVTITLNGRLLNTSRFKPGVEFLLDADSPGVPTDR